jgi:UDP-N-acetylmuramate dehydrogenase
VKPRGKLTENAPIGSESWFACGGTADLLFEPADFDDLVSFLKDSKEPLTIIGGLANTIIRDGGVRGVTIRLGKKEFAKIHVEGTKISAGAGALNGSVAAAAVKAGVGGLEFLSGIPGSVGGALRMNAGAYGSEVKDVLVECTAVDRTGNIRTLKPADMHMTYRHTDVPEDWIFTHAIFKGVQEDYGTVKNRLNEIKVKRNETQPIREKTGGSTFANPDGQKAWQLIDKSGCRNHIVGGARMSELHCNFMINTGNATASDLEKLGDDLIKIVKEKTGVTLRWEIRRLGEPRQNQPS